MSMIIVQNSNITKKPSRRNGFSETANTFYETQVTAYSPDAPPLEPVPAEAPVCESVIEV